MFSDLQRRYFWIQPTVSYKDADQLVKYVDDAIIARADSAAKQIKKRRAEAVQAPVSVMSLNRRPKKSPASKPAEANDEQEVQRHAISKETTE
jgi:hypothetical protein